MDLSTFAVDGGAARVAEQAARGLLVAMSRETLQLAESFAVEAVEVDLEDAPDLATKLRTEPPLVFGAGLVAGPDDGQQHPVVLVDRLRLDGPGEVNALVPVAESKVVHDALDELLESGGDPVRLSRR